MRPFPRSFLPLSVAAYGALTACTSIHDQHRSTLTTEARLQVAEAADASGDSDLAISMYIAAAANNPANIELQLRCADALARSGKVAQARQILTESLRANHGQIDLIRALAVIDLVAGQPVQAIAEFDQVLAANPGDSRARADTWVQVRDRAGAVLLNRMLHPGDSWAVPAKPNLLLTTGNAGDIDLVVDGLTSPSLGGHGVVRHDLPLDPDLIKDGRLVTVSPQPDPK